MIQIALIDDHAMFRHGLEEILKGEDVFSISGSFPTVTEFLKSDIAADILFLDLSLEDGLSLEHIAPIRKKYPTIKILVLTMHNKSILIKKALQAGAEGYVIKQSSPTVLREAVHQIAAGRYFLDPALSESLVMLIREFDGEAGHNQRGISLLSKREQEVFTLVAEGLSNDQISRRLYISRKTVENHKFRIMQKLELSSTGELIDFARKIGIV